MSNSEVPKKRGRKKKEEETKESVKVIQVRVGTRASKNLKEWSANQGEDVNENARLALDFFIEIFGKGNVKSGDVLEKIARFKKIDEGTSFQTTTVIQQPVQTQVIEQPVIQEEVINKIEPVKEVKKPVVNKEENVSTEARTEEVEREDIDF